MKELPPQVTDPADVVELTCRLVQIPSYVNVRDPKTNELVPESQRVDERGVATYIADFLRQHTNLTVTTQEVVDGRFNVIAANSDKPKLVLLGHTDTVKPSGGIYDQLAGEIHDGKIYGLGATDMKSGLASILSAVSLFEELPDVRLAFYIDEEYDFAGMKALINDLPAGQNPDLLFSADGDSLELGNGCRGLIELHGTFLGKSAHAGRPQEGINAINGVVDAFKDLQNGLKQYSTEDLGNCTVNLARLEGGKRNVNAETGNIEIVDQVNSVPDIARFKVDIRTSSPNANPEAIIAELAKYCQKHGLTLDQIDAHHNLGAWYTDKSDLQRLGDIVERVTGKPVKYGDPKKKGYLDMQMLWDRLGRPTAAMFGAGEGKLAHHPDEYVEIEDLIKSRDVFAGVIESFGGRRKVSTP